MSSDAANAAMGRLVGIGFIVLGCMITIAGLAIVIHTAVFVLGASKAPGTVIEMERDATSDGGSTYHPIFAFTDAAGILHTQRSSFGSSDFAFEAGEQITVVYDPKKPSRSKINSFQTLWLGPIILIGFGLLFAGFASFWLVLWVRGARLALQKRGSWTFEG